MAPPFVITTGWNEWTAGKYERPNLPVVFVDQFDQEFSRDIEPVTNLHGDNYYYQMVAGIRRYKGLPTTASPSPETKINITDAFSVWSSIQPGFLDHQFDNDHRDFGNGEVRYQNESGRHDLVLSKVANDSKDLFFYLQTRGPLPGPSMPV